MDFLSKKKKINEGEIQQYYIEGSHPAIIAPEFFDLVQIEFEKRKGRKRSTAGVFASMLICGDCGNFYGSKVWHSTSQYRKTIWQCNRKFKNNSKCSTPHFSEEQLKTAFTEMFNSTVENRDIIIASVEEAINRISDSSKLDEKISQLKIKLESAAKHIRSWVSKNAHCAMNQVEYETEYQNRNAAYKKIADEISVIEKEKTLLLNKQKEARTTLNLLRENKEPLAEFDEALFFGLIENIIVKSKDTLIFNFKDGTEIEWKI